MSSYDREEFPPWLIVLGLGAVALILYEISKGASAVGNAIANNPITQGISSGIADAYVGLTSAPAIAAQGMLASQSGQVLGPVSSFPASTQNGVTYLNVNGTTYQLGPRNASGNFTAIAVAPAGGTYPAGSTYPQGGTYPPGATVPAGSTGGT